MRGALVVAVAVATAVISVADAAPPKPHIFMMIVDVRSASLQLATMHVLLFSLVYHHKISKLQLSCMQCVHGTPHACSRKSCTLYRRGAACVSSLAYALTKNFCPANVVICVDQDCSVATLRRVERPNIITCACAVVACCMLHSHGV